MIYVLSLGVIALDQLTKWWALIGLPKWEAVSVFPCFNLYLTFNKGVSFSFLSNNHPVTPWILSGLAIAVCIMIVGWMRREKSRLVLTGLALILGGAIANVIDRIRFGAVVDFLDFYIGRYHWPAFNIADSAICLGVMLIFIHWMKESKRAKD